MESKLDSHPRKKQNPKCDQNSINFTNFENSNTQFKLEAMDTKNKIKSGITSAYLPSPLKIFQTEIPINSRNSKFENESISIHRSPAQIPNDDKKGAFINENESLAQNLGTFSTYTYLPKIDASSKVFFSTAK